MPQNRSSSAFFTLSFGTGSRISGSLSHPTGTPAADIAACCEAACALVVTSAKLLFGVCAFSRLVQRGAVISKTRIEPANESDRQTVSNPFVNFYQSALGQIVEKRLQVLFTSARLDVVLGKESISNR